MQNEPVEVTLKVTQILEELGIPYLSSESSERQWRDILGVLKTRAAELDLDYLQKWATEIKVHDLLERALRSAA